MLGRVGRSVWIDAFKSACGCAWVRVGVRVGVRACVCGWVFSGQLASFLLLFLNVRQRKKDCDCFLVRPNYIIAKKSQAVIFKNARIQICWRRRMIQFCVESLIFLAFRELDKWFFGFPVKKWWKRKCDDSWNCLRCHLKKSLQDACVADFSF